MKILSLYYTHKPGGFCKRLYRMLAALAEAGHQVTYLCLDQPPSDLSPKVAISLIPFPTRARNGAIFWLTFTLWGTAWVTYRAWRVKPDRIAVFGAYYGSLCYPAQKTFDVPIVLFIRSLVFKINQITEKPTLLSICSDLLERFGMKRATRLVAISASMADNLRLFIGQTRQIVILPNDCTPPSKNLKVLEPDLLTLLQSKKQGGSILVLISGVFDQRKNLTLVINSFIELSKVTPNHSLELIVAGTGPELSLAKERLSTQPNQCVTFTGWISSLEPVFPFIDLVIHPSKHEGMPNSVLEAWGSGCATLLANIPELSEMVHGEDLLFDSNNHAQLLERLLKIAQNPDQTLESLRQSSQRASLHFRFDWDQRAIELIENLDCAN